MKVLILVLFVIILGLQSFPQTQIRFDNSGFADDDELEKINNEPAIAVNPLNNNNIVIATNYRELTGNPNPTYNAAHLGIYYSNNYGSSWGFNYLPKMGKALNGDPSLAFDASGRVWAAYIGYNSPNVTGTVDDHKSGVYVNYSNNGGVN